LNETEFVPDSGDFNDTISTPNIPGDSRNPRRWTVIFARVVLLIHVVILFLRICHDILFLLLHVGSVINKALKCHQVINKGCHFCKDEHGGKWVELMNGLLLAFRDLGYGSLDKLNEHVDLGEDY